MRPCARFDAPLSDAISSASVADSDDRARSLLRALCLGLCGTCNFRDSARRFCMGVNGRPGFVFESLFSLVE